MNKNNLFRLILGILLSAVGGFLFVLAFPPYEIWPLALIWLVPILIAQHRVMPPKLTSLAPAIGIAIWLQGYIGAIFAPIGTYMVWLPVAGFFISLFTDYSLRNFHLKTGYKWFIVSGVATWAGIEMIRLFIPIAGTWGFIANTFFKQTMLIQPVSIFGIIGMGMVIVMINYTLALLVLYVFDKYVLNHFENHDSKIGNSVVKKRVSFTAKVCVIITIAWFLICFILYNIPLSKETVRVAAIQPYTSPIVTFNQGGDVESIHSRMIEQTRDAASQGAKFIVWPEASFVWDPLIEDRLELAKLAQELGIHIAIGYVVIEEEGLRNEATVINPNGEFLGVFGKDHPVVFGGETSLTRGTYPVYETEIGNIGTIICYDLDYTDTSRKVVSNEAMLIAVPSNDWGAIADKHYAHVVFRAVENRVAMVKADGSFDSAIINPKGEILKLAVFPEGGEATLVSDVNIGTGKGTISTRLGDFAGWIGLAGLIFFAIFEKRLIQSYNKKDLETI